MYFFKRERDVGKLQNFIHIVVGGDKVGHYGIDHLPWVVWLEMCGNRAQRAEAGSVAGGGWGAQEGQGLVTLGHVGAHQELRFPG